MFESIPWTVESILNEVTDGLDKAGLTEDVRDFATSISIDVIKKMDRSQKDEACLFLAKPPSVKEAVFKKMRSEHPNISVDSFMVVLRALYLGRLSVASLKFAGRLENTVKYSNTRSVAGSAGALALVYMDEISIDMLL